MFVGSGGTWVPQAELTASDGASSNLFGEAVAMSGSTVIVRAVLALGSPGYVFVRSAGTWSQEAKLIPSDCPTGDGPSVSIFGSTAVLGGWASGPFDTGAACVFVRSGGAWSEQARLTASDTVSNDKFGYSVAIYGSTLVVSATGKNSSAGTAYVFVRSGTTWSQREEFPGSDVPPGAEFGLSVAISGSVALVGAPAIGLASTTGAAYVFEL